MSKTLRFYFEFLYLAAFVYLLIMTIAVIRLLFDPFAEDPLEPFLIFLKDPDGWFYISTWVFMIYSIFKKSKLKGKLSWIPFR